MHRRHQPHRRVKRRSGSGELEAEITRLRAEVARLEADRRLGREGALAVEQLAAVKAYAPKILAEALEWTRTH